MFAVKTFPTLGKNIGCDAHSLTELVHPISDLHNISTKLVTKDKRRRKFRMPATICLHVCTAGRRSTHLNQQFACCRFRDRNRPQFDLLCLGADTRGGGSARRARKPQGRTRRPRRCGSAAESCRRLDGCISRAPTLGYIWTNDVTGYSIKYAYHASMPDGSERIILATDRRLGAYSPAWQP